MIAALDDEYPELHHTAIPSVADIMSWVERNITDMASSYDDLLDSHAQWMEESLWYNELAA